VVLVCVLVGKDQQQRRATRSLLASVTFIRESGDCVVGEVAVREGLWHISAERYPGGPSIECL
jgi:hypothetical protein